MSKPWRFIDINYVGYKEDWVNKERAKFEEIRETAEKLERLLSSLMEDRDKMLISEFDDCDEAKLEIDLEDFRENTYNLEEALRVFIRKHDEWDGSWEDDD